MAQAALRPTVRGPTFIRLLARLAEIDVAAPGQSLPDRLGQWLDWNHALSLAAALDGQPAASEAAAPAPDDLQAECARARETLATAIKDAPLLAPGASMPAEPDYAPYRQLCLTRQRALQATTGRLRGKLRDALPLGSPGLAHLAEVDAVMEAALTPREHALLAKVPELLGQRFERLRAAGHASATWLDGFRRDMQSVLLAELDLRFQPVDALLAALRTP
ncbi:DUF3348 domain-containing protein [Frateuria sp. STR12]|uniref:DUF3348 domain-containing protein n=1 Tax=Frateuria hangzhouensis TaxID=2995589 RepID=UPI002260B89A|nr:DUF3348 domain-containing protein [Frateuria sp. STR12]MCX7515162.1 DUF3348 domain-containing protein [Frateuria sp. STR12]